MATKHWSWAHFTTDHLYFRNNSYYKNASAWCTACLNHHKEQLRQADIVNTAISGTNSGQTDEDLEAQGIESFSSFLWVCDWLAAL